MRHYQVHEIFASWQGEGINAGRSAVFVRLQGCPVGCSWCLGGATKVQMLKGPQKRIAEVAIGDVLVGYDEATGTLQNTTVVATHQHEADALWVMEDPNGHDNMTTICTPDHQFYSKRGWIRADEMTQHEELYTSADLDLKRWIKRHSNPMQRSDVAARVSAAQQRVWTQEKRDRQREIHKAMSCHRERMLGDLNPMKRVEVRRRQISTAKRNGNYGTSKIETRVARLIEELGLPFDHCQMDVEIDGRYPDFAALPARKVIEVYHPTFQHREERGYATAKRLHYEQAGYQCLALSVGYGVTDEQLARQLTSFALNGKTPRGVHPISEMADRARGRDRTVYDLTCEPYPTFFANGWLTHNCDAKLTWYAGGRRLGMDEIVAAIIDLPETDLLVITGGEPMLYDLDGMLAVFARLFADRVIQIETSGGFAHKGAEYRADHYTVSPKENLGFAVADDVLALATELKYVVDERFDPLVIEHALARWEELTPYGEHLVPPPVVLMPEGCPPGPAMVEKTLTILREHPRWQFGPRLQYAYPAIAAYEGDTNQQLSAAEARRRSVLHRQQLGLRA